MFKIISYENDSKYITCSKDKSIISRNCEDNTLIKTLIDHKEQVHDILLLSDGRLVSASYDANCEQILIGHVYEIYCLLELRNSIFLSASSDLSIGVRDISH